MALDCFIHSNITSSSTWGFPRSSNFQSEIYSHTTLKISNFIGYFLSPLAGLIRIICTIILFWKVNRQDTTADVDGTNGFLWSQLTRGTVELVGFGIFLLPVDLYCTHKDQQTENSSSQKF